MGGDKEMHDTQTLQLLEARRVKGEQIADIDGYVERVDSSTYRVHSQSGEVWYVVKHNFRGWSCDCADFKVPLGKATERCGAPSLDDWR